MTIQDGAARGSLGNLLTAARDKSICLALIAAGGTVLTWSYTHVAWADPGTWHFLAAFVCITVPLLAAQVMLASRSRYYSMDDVAIYALIFSTGTYANPPWAVGVWVLFAASTLYLTCELVDARSRGQELGWERLVYEFSSPFARVTYLALAGSVYEHVNNGAPFLASWHNLLAIMLTVVAYMAFTAAVDIVETLVHGDRLRNLLDIYRTLLLNIVMLAPLGIVLTLLWQHEWTAIVLLAVPVGVMHYSMKSVRSIVDQAQLAIETMMNALEQRDRYTAGHSERVGLFAGIIACALGLPDEEVRRIRCAGRIHDIGKIDIPDAILWKSCCLDEHEFSVMKTHTDRPKEYAEKYPRLGRHIPFYMAACHHERFDGSGYVHGLRGEDIPLGARIIAVADAWDAMTTDRPYRAALSDAKAMQRLYEGLGSQFDRTVVRAFKRAYESGIISQVMYEWKEIDRLRQARRDADAESRRRRSSTAA